jgi:acetate kinase
VSSAPLHLPATIEAARLALEVFEEALVVLVFETAFFHRLPQRERLCGLDANTRRRLVPQRVGFHGLYHEAACRQTVAKRLHLDHGGSCRALSICLEPRPELAAVIDRRPIMVTGGQTPLEGLVGETDCGELDPGIVLRLAARPDLGPEEVNEVLTRDSGLLALTGKAVSLQTVLCATGEEYRLAREVFTYHLLQACGAGIAALGGLDAIVFSGRYAAAGKALSSAIVPHLAVALSKAPQAVEVSYFEDSLEHLIALAALDYLYAVVPEAVGVRALRAATQPLSVPAGSQSV